MTPARDDRYCCALEADGAFPPTPCGRQPGHIFLCPRREGRAHPQQSLDCRGPRASRAPDDAHCPGWQLKIPALKTACRGRAAMLTALAYWQPSLTIGRVVAMPK